MIDYDKYVYTKVELVKYGLAGGIIGFVMCMLFYDSLILSFIAFVIGAVVFLKVYKRTCIEKRKWELTVSFKDAMDSLVSALVAGYSLENAVLEAAKDLRLLYKDGDIIIMEFDYMSKQIGLNESAADLMGELGRRSHVEDIIVFGEILVTAKKTGGNLVKVMKKTSADIAGKIEMKREIATLISGKKMEATCMTAIPLFMIVYLRLFSTGFLDPLYHNLIGIIIMTFALCVYIVSFFWGRSIMNIKL